MGPKRRTRWSRWPFRLDPTAPQISIPEDEIFTVGDHSFVCRKFDHITGGRAYLIPYWVLEQIGEFENAHPDLEIIKQDFTTKKTGDAVLIGLWLHHRPKNAVSRPASAIAEKGEP